MKEIWLIKDISWDGELRAIGHRNRVSSLFLRQGDLDAACAVYSLMMLLMLHKKINRNELVDRRAAQNVTGGGYNAFMRLQDKILGELPGSYQDGYFFEELAEKLNKCFKSVATARAMNAWDNKTKKNRPANSPEKKELVKSIMDTLGVGYPVEIGFSRKGSCGHAVVAIGYTTHHSYVRLFCLDPAFDIANTAFWNTIIDVSYFESNRAIYCDKCFTPDGNMDMVAVDEILTINE